MPLLGAVVAEHEGVVGSHRRGLGAKGKNIGQRTKR